MQDIGLFEGEQEKALEKEIARKYFIRKIVKINELKEKNGMTIWKVTDADGNKPEFSLKDTYGSIFRVSDERFVITDADGNRFDHLRVPGGAPARILGLPDGHNRP